jgi:tetratricopeptide (TPR) repeat protein
VNQQEEYGRLKKQHEALTKERNDWEDKRHHHSLELVKTSDSSKKFELEKEIERCEGKINSLSKELESLDAKINGLAPSPVHILLQQADIPLKLLGRDQELEQLKEHLIHRRGQKRSNIVGIHGQPGVGKTALAFYFAENYSRDFPGGVFSIPVDIKERSINAIAREFTAAAGGRIKDRDRQSAATIMQQIFRNRKALLIFDNVDDEKIRELLPGGDQCAVIITTFNLPLFHKVAGFREKSIRLKPLSEEHSLKLLKEALGYTFIQNEETAAKRIIQLVGNLPIALKIVAAALQTERWETLTEYANQLEEENSRLSLLSVPYLDVRTPFYLSLKTLTKEEKDFFARLGACPKDGFSVYAAKSTGNFSKSTTENYLYQLKCLSLIDRLKSLKNHYIFHVLIHLFAREIAEGSNFLNDAERKHAGFAKRLIKINNLKNQKIISFVKEDLNSIMAAAQWLKQQEILDKDFIDCLEPFFKKQNLVREASEFLSIFQALAEQLREWETSIGLRIRRATYLSKAGNFSKALEELEPIVQLNRIYDQDSRLKQESSWRTVRAQILERLDRLEEAEKDIERSIEIEREQGTSKGLAMALTSLGRNQRRRALRQRDKEHKRGLLKSALASFEESERISEANKHKQGLSMVLTSEAEVLADLERFAEAMKKIERSITLEDEQNDQIGKAKAIFVKGKLLEKQNNLLAAADNYSKSFELRKDNDEHGSAMVLDKLGRLLVRLERYQEAAKHFLNSCELKAKVGDQVGLLSSIDALCKTIKILSESGQQKEALEYCKKSLEISPKNLQLSRIYAQLNIDNASLVE